MLIYRALHTLSGGRRRGGNGRILRIQVIKHARIPAATTLLRLLSLNLSRLLTLLLLLTVHALKILGGSMRRRGALANDAATLQRAAQGNLVRILQVATDRKTRRQTRQTHTQRHEHAREVGCGRLTLKVRVHRQNNLLDTLIRQAGHQLTNTQLLRAHTRQRVNGATEHMVATGKGTGAFNRHHVLRFFDHTQHGRVAALITTDGAQLCLGDVTALLAETDAGLHRGNGVG